MNVNKVLHILAPA